jgi:hypothetical protein
MTSQQASCPACHQPIPLVDVNVATDVALCRSCEKPFSYAEILERATRGGVDLNRPPAGARFERSMRGFEVTATTRSIFALFIVPFMCVWSSGALGGIYGRQLREGRFDLGQSLFGLPFLLGTLVFGGVALMTIAGKVQVQVEGDEGSVFTGVGPVGWRRRFDWSEIRAVYLSQKSGRRGSSEQITLEGQTQINFGIGLSSERRYFLLSALRQMLRERR